MPVTPRYRKSRRRPGDCPTSSPLETDNINHSRDVVELSPSPDTVYKVKPAGCVNLAFTGCPCHSPMLQLQDYDDSETNSNYSRRTPQTKKTTSDKRIYSKRYNIQDSEYHNKPIKSGPNAHPVGSSSQHDLKNKTQGKFRNSTRQTSPFSSSASTRNNSKYDTIRMARDKPKIYQHRYSESNGVGERYNPGRSLKTRASSPQRPGGDNDIDIVKPSEYEASQETESPGIYQQGSASEILSLINRSPQTPWCQHCCERCCPDGCSRLRCRSKSKSKNPAHATVDRMFEDVFKSLVVRGSVGGSGVSSNYSLNRADDRNCHNSLGDDESCEYREINDLDNDEDSSNSDSLFGSREDVSSQSDDETQNSKEDGAASGSACEDIRSVKERSVGTPKIFFTKNVVKEDESFVQTLPLNIDDIPTQLDISPKHPDDECGSSVDPSDVSILVNPPPQEEACRLTTAQEKYLEEPGVVLVSLKDGQIRFTPNRIGNDKRTATPEVQTRNLLECNSVDRTVSTKVGEQTASPHLLHNLNKRDPVQASNAETDCHVRVCKDTSTEEDCLVKGPCLSLADVSSTDISERHSLEICEKTIEALVAERACLVHKVTADVESVGDDQNTGELGSVSCSELVRCSKHDRDDISCPDDVSSSAPAKTHSLLTACDGMSESNVNEVMAIISQEVNIKRYPSVPDLTDLHDSDDPAYSSSEVVINTQSVNQARNETCANQARNKTCANQARNETCANQARNETCTNQARIETFAKADKALLEVGEKDLPPNTPAFGTLPGSGYVETMVSLYESSFALSKDPPIIGMFKDRQSMPRKSPLIVSNVPEGEQDSGNGHHESVDFVSEQLPYKNTDDSDMDVILPSPPSKSPEEMNSGQEIKQGSIHSLSPSSSTNYINKHELDGRETNCRSAYSPVPKPCTEHLNSYDLLVDNMSSTCDVSLSNFIDSSEEKKILERREYQLECPLSSNSSCGQQSLHDSEALGSHSDEAGETPSQRDAVISSASGFGDTGEMKEGAVKAESAATDYVDGRVCARILSMGTDDYDDSFEQRTNQMSSVRGFGDAGEIKPTDMEADSYAADDMEDNVSKCPLSIRRDYQENLYRQWSHPDTNCGNDYEDFSYERALKFGSVQRVPAVEINTILVDDVSYAADDEEGSSVSRCALSRCINGHENTCERWSLQYNNSGNDEEDFAYTQALISDDTLNSQNCSQAGSETAGGAEANSVPADDMDDSVSRCHVISVNSHGIAWEQPLHTYTSSWNEDLESLYEKALLESGSVDNANTSVVSGRDTGDRLLTIGTGDQEFSLRDSYNDDQYFAIEKGLSRKLAQRSARLATEAAQRDARLAAETQVNPDVVLADSAATDADDSTSDWPVSISTVDHEYTCDQQMRPGDVHGNDEQDVFFEKALSAGECNSFSDTSCEDHGKVANNLRKQIIRESKHSGGLMKGIGSSSASPAENTKKCADSSNVDNPFKSLPHGETGGTFVEGLVGNEQSMDKRKTLLERQTGVTRRKDCSLDRFKSDTRARKKERLSDAGASDRSNSCCLQMRHHFISSNDNRSWHLNGSKKSFDCNATFSLPEETEKKENRRNAILKECLNDTLDKQTTKGVAGDIGGARNQNSSTKHKSVRKSGQYKLTTNGRKDYDSKVYTRYGKAGQVPRSISQPVSRRKKVMPKCVKRAKTVVVTTHSVVKGVPCPQEADLFRHIDCSTDGKIVTIETRYPENLPTFAQRATPEPETDTESSSRTLIDNVGECWSSPEHYSSSTTLTQEDLLDMPDLPVCPDVYKLNETNNFPTNYSPTFVSEHETGQDAQRATEKPSQCEPSKSPTHTTLRPTQCSSNEISPSRSTQVSHREAPPNVGFLHVVKIDDVYEEQTMYTRRVGAAASSVVKTVSVTSSSKTGPTHLNKSENHCSDSSCKLNEFVGKRQCATPHLRFGYPLKNVQNSKRSCSCDENPKFCSWRSLKDTKTHFKQAHTLPSRIRLSSSAAVRLQPKEARNRSVGHSAKLAWSPARAKQSPGKSEGPLHCTEEVALPSKQVPLRVSTNRQSKKVEQSVFQSRLNRPQTPAQVNKNRIPRKQHEFAARAQRHVEKCDSIIARSNRRIELSKTLVDTSRRQISRAKGSLNLN